MSGTDDLLAGLAAAGSSLDEALDAVAAAQQRASEAVDYFAGLGGSAGRAQAVHDLIWDVHAGLEAVAELLEAAVTTVHEVSTSSTPEENVEKLSAAIEQIHGTVDAVTAGAEACGEAEREVQGHLAGSSAAEELAALMAQAQDSLQRARAQLDTVNDAASAQQEVYRDGSGGTAGSGPPASAATPPPSQQTRPNPAADTAPRPDDVAAALGDLPGRPANDRPTVGVLLDQAGRRLGAPIRSSRDSTLLQGLDLPVRAMKSESMTSHVEAKVAAMIRRGHVPAVTTLVINNDRGPCGWLMRLRGQRRYGTSCDENLSDVLPAGAVLTVWWRDTDGVTRSAVYRGTGRGIRT